MSTMMTLLVCVCVDSGFVCISLPGERVEELKLPMMVANNTETFKTAYTITVDYAIGKYLSVLSCNLTYTLRFPINIKPLLV